MNLYLSFAVFLFTACSDVRVEKIETLQSGDKIELSLKKTDTKVFDIKLQEKKALFLTFFTTNCGACKEEIPSLNKLEKEFKNRVKILAVMGEKISEEKAKEFIKKYEISYEIISDKKSANLLSRAVGGVFGVPVIFIFDKNGKLFKKFSGFIPHEVLRKKILEL